MLWFAWKYLPLWYQQQRSVKQATTSSCCDLLENIYLCGINNNSSPLAKLKVPLWFAWKYLPLWYQQQLCRVRGLPRLGCDLLENIYLCGINNNTDMEKKIYVSVVICLKISTFVVSTTTWNSMKHPIYGLWFAWKYLPLWYQQQQGIKKSCIPLVVICLKISTFVVSTTTCYSLDVTRWGCDLLENIYLCGINNNY